MEDGAADQEKDDAAEQEARKSLVGDVRFGGCVMRIADHRCSASKGLCTKMDLRIQEKRSSGYLVD